jgi:hypothetical protein
MEPKVLHANSQHNFQKYLSAVGSPGASKKSLKSTQEGQESAVYWLNKSIYEAATAIKFAPKDHTLHFWLANLLQEKYFFENLYGPAEQVHTRVQTVLVLLFLLWEGCVF